MAGKGRMNDTSHNRQTYEHSVTSGPCTIMEENMAGGWSKIAKPEGGTPKKIMTSGSRGQGG